MLIFKCCRAGEAHFNGAEHNVNTGILLFEALHKSSPDLSGFSMYLTPPGQLRRVTSRRVNRPWISVTGTGRSADQAVKIVEPTLTRERRKPGKPGRPKKARRFNARSAKSDRSRAKRQRLWPITIITQAISGTSSATVAIRSGPFQKRPGLSEGCAGLYSGTGAGSNSIILLVRSQGLPGFKQGLFFLYLVLIQKAPREFITHLPGPP